MGVAPGNEEQHRSWDGEGGAYWAAHAERFDGTMARYHRHLLSAAAIGAGDRVLDVGCGTGLTTRDAARAATGGSALGVDLSSEMLAYARRRAAEEGLTNVGFEEGDAQVHPFDPAAFDLTISRMGSMFFGDPMAAFANIAGAMRPAARLVLAVWQPLSANEWFRSFLNAVALGRDLPAPPEGAPGPFSLGDPDRVRGILTESGFAGVELEPVREPMCFGADADDAAWFVSGLLRWLLGDLDDDGRARALESLRATMAAHQTGDGVTFDSAAWLVRAERP